jgi:phosphoribosylaminoimidazole-succinocarboxamide synthase
LARRKKIYEGKAKTLYEGPEPGTVVQYFKDDATAYNAEKKDVIEGKGVLNNILSEYFMLGLTNIGIPNHFLKRLNMREQLVRSCEIVPLEVIVRNYAAGSMAKRLGIDEGTQLPRPIVEYCLKEDKLGDPIVTEEHIAAFGWASQQDMDDILSLALRVNDFLSGVMYGVGIKLVDFKIEIGRIYEGDFMRLVVADEISPDSCRLWDLRVPPRSWLAHGRLHRGRNPPGRHAQEHQPDNKANADQLIMPPRNQPAPPRHANTGM